MRGVNRSVTDGVGSACQPREREGRWEGAHRAGCWPAWAEGEEVRPSGQKTDGELFLFLLFCFLFISFYFKVFSKQFQIILIIF